MGVKEYKTRGKTKRYNINYELLNSRGNAGVVKNSENLTHDSPIIPEEMFLQDLIDYAKSQNWMIYESVVLQRIIQAMERRLSKLKEAKEK